MSIRGTGGESILLVDDVEEIRDAIERLLRANGYKVDAARSEESAIEAALRSPPHLLLLSLAGPSQAIAESGRRIRQRARLTREVPIVVFGAEQSDDAAQVDVEDNIHVVDPENFDALRDFIGRLLSLPPSSQGSG